MLQQLIHTVPAAVWSAMRWAFADVARSDAGGEAVHVVVGARHKLGGIGERHGHNHGTKDLFLHDLQTFAFAEVVVG
jgi:hypothetical protein